jgi:WhiB family transcriptional regulator, redox-sensing transcriptional regulator
MALEWMERAACLPADPESFFPVGKGGQADEQVAYVRHMYCGPCGVSGECLSFALTNHINDGVWGGLAPDERESLKRRNARARAKEPAPVARPALPPRGPNQPRGAYVGTGQVRKLIIDSGLTNVAVGELADLNREVVRRIRSGERTTATEATVARLRAGLAAVTS